MSKPKRHKAWHLKKTNKYGKNDVCCAQFYQMLYQCYIGKKPIEPISVNDALKHTKLF